MGGRMPGGGGGAGPPPPPPPRSGLLRLFLAVEPVERAGHGALPVLVVLVALRGLHLRLPALVLDPVLAQVLDLVPEPGREARRVGRAQRRRLGDRRPDDRDP